MVLPGWGTTFAGRWQYHTFSVYESHPRAILSVRLDILMQWVLFYADPNGAAGRDYTNETRLQAYNAVIPSLSTTGCFVNQENPYEYVRANQGTQVFLAADGVHPSNGGQYRLSTIWANGALASSRF